MSDIDPEKLESALNHIDAISAGYLTGHQEVIVKAARAHLSTLPRFKEVEIEQWAVIKPDGEVETVWSSEGWATRFAAGHSVVRLTGAAKVKVTP